ncbi:type 1 glutamine amidotransferase [uncultured Roseobacter sp.]|uniref:type 1 glutamine amidotransferase n=1 Tax=uncultured Roseobacter sp. TaxID=114847 RepID=UPI0026226892|nr:type 1 glutamine amidotransferase [uncultured Roseobacter sp.]
MLKILIVDSDPGDANTRNQAEVGHTTGEGYADALKACRSDLTIDIVSPYDGEDLPDLAGFDGVVFTGSGVAWCTDAPEAKPLAAAMQRCFAAGLPTLGSCNGMQLAATVLGGRNHASPNGREDGLARDIQLTAPGRRHPLLAGRQDGYAVPCVHRDEVAQLPDGAVLLATNAHSDVQAFAYEQDGIRFWGVQYHPEYTLPFIGGRVRAWDRLPDQQARDIEIADTDPEAAKRLRVRYEDMQSDMRLTELRNWLASL